MKLYTYTLERSLPRLAVKGLPGDPYRGAEFHAKEDLWQVAEGAIEAADYEKDTPVILEVDTKDFDEFGIDGAWLSDTVDGMRDSEGDEVADKFVAKLEASETTDDLMDAVGWVFNMADIPPSALTVLGAPEGWKEDIAQKEAQQKAWEEMSEEELEEITGEVPEAPQEVVFKAKPKPLKAFKRPLVTRLMRSIFLPTPKLYGARPVLSGRSLGHIAEGPEKEIDPVVRTVEGHGTVAELVWGAGKKFRKGLRKRFGREIGDAMADFVVERVGAEPGKLLGSGKMGAVYRLPGDRVLKITMDGPEVNTATLIQGMVHPGLATVHQAFVMVTPERQGVGIIVRDSIDTTLLKFNKDAAAMLDTVITEGVVVSEGVMERLSDDIGSEVELHREGLKAGMEYAIQDLRNEGCVADDALPFDIADGLRALQFMGIYGMDWDARNIGIVKGTKGEPSRAVLFDYGLTIGPPADVYIVEPRIERRAKVAGF